MTVTTNEAIVLRFEWWPPDSGSPHTMNGAVVCRFDVWWAPDDRGYLRAERAMPIPGCPDARRKEA